MGKGRAVLLIINLCVITGTA